MAKCESENLDTQEIKCHNPAEVQPTYDNISEMVDLFYANKRLYNRVRQGEK